jgi:hypothetical protein
MYSIESRAEGENIGLKRERRERRNWNLERMFE